MPQEKTKVSQKILDSSRTWFCVLNSPRTIWGENITPLEMVNTALDLWMEGKTKRSCAGNYEIGDTGNEHMHLVLCDPQKSRFAAIQKLFPGIHIEPMRGSKEDAEAYIRKSGRFEEKAHTIVVPAIFRGEICANRGHRNDLEAIEEMLNDGMLPEEIMDRSLAYRRYEKYIKGAFFRLQSKKTAPLRKITVYWHVGASGSGKTYAYVQLCETRGEDNVYLMSDYGTGGLDKYESQPILFMDEFKGRLAFADLLGYLEGYKKQIHCRYQNVLALWNEVHITSVFPPEAMYEVMVDMEQRSLDEYEQLRRRLDFIVYHYKENDEFKQVQIPISEYINYSNLILRVKGEIQPPVRAEPPKPEFKQSRMDLIPDGMEPIDFSFTPCETSPFDKEALSDEETLENSEQ